MKCSECGAQISKRWLFLGLPWSKYSCSRCGAMFAGTILRTTLTSIAVGILGYLLIPAIKGKMSPTFIIPIAALTLVLFMGNFPGLIKRIDIAEPEIEREPE